VAYDIFRKAQTGANWSLGASFTTSTEDVDDRLSSLTVDVNNLNADITQYWFPKHKDDIQARRFLSAWIAWRDGTYKFIRGWKEGTFKIKLAWNYMDDANQKISELAEWRRRWEALSGEKSTAPATLPPPPPKSDGAGIWKWVAALAIGAAGATLVAKKLGA
jgi:hypothetical protein